MSRYIISMKETGSTTNGGPNFILWDIGSAHPGEAMSQVKFLLPNAKHYWVDHMMDIRTLRNSRIIRNFDES